MTDFIDGDFHELTTANNDDHGVNTGGDVRHKNPYDRHAAHIWFWEEPAVEGVLTQDGVTQIAYHQYVPGEYTALDTLLNPVWVQLTEWLPMWLAPNTVTAIGGLHATAAYWVTWLYTPNYHPSDQIPAWVFFWNAYCHAVYYTLDCMDGKQARRTGSSSPLGQLFDHGIDCLCLQQHLSMAMSWVLAGGEENVYWYLWTQAALQFVFFAAQWEEYYTGSLPHAKGNVGVTEMNYGFVLACAVNAFLPHRQQIYSKPLAHLIPESIFQTLSSFLPFLQNMQLKHAMLCGWYCTVIGLFLSSLTHVMQHLKTNRLRNSALTKLISPTLVALAPIVLISTEIAAREMRWISLTVGLSLTLMTIKLIVFSMARQAYAAIQVTDCVLVMAACLWPRYDLRLTEAGVHLLWQVIFVFHIIRIVLWTKAAVQQICQRMDIYLFRIKQKAHDKKKE